MTTQIQPPLTEKEMTWLFINTLKAPYYSHMIAGATMSFTDMVLIGEMVENALKTGKLDDGESSVAKESSKKKEGEVSTVRCEGYHQQYPQPQCQPCQHQYHPANFTPPHNTCQYPPPNYTQPQNAYQYPVSNTISTAPRPNTQNRNSRPAKKRKQLTPIPMTYTELYTKLLDSKMIEPVQYSTLL